MGEIFLANLGTVLVRDGPPSDAQSNRKPRGYSAARAAMAMRCIRFFIEIHTPLVFLPNGKENKGSRHTLWCCHHHRFITQWVSHWFDQ